MIYRAQQRTETNLDVHSGGVKVVCRRTKQDSDSIQLARDYIDLLGSRDLRCTESVAVGAAEGHSCGLTHPDVGVGPNWVGHAPGILRKLLLPKQGDVLDPLCSPRVHV